VNAPDLSGDELNVTHLNTKLTLSTRPALDIIAVDPQSTKVYAEKIPW
jgi:hypothetical protein